jgi:DNA-binding XRE family transcriptional regulator
MLTHLAGRAKRAIARFGLTARRAISYNAGMDDMHAEDPLHQLFCRRVRSLREAEGWTQQEAARRLGVSQARYADIEGGRKEPGLSVTRKVAKLFGLKAHELLDPKFSAELVA